MITNFPIIDTIETKRKFFTMRRDQQWSNKLELIFNRLKVVTKELPAQKICLQTSSNLEIVEQHIESLDSNGAISHHRYNSLNESSRKRFDKLNRSFNRTKVDWDHNFVGNRYLQKIKQELKSTKYRPFSGLKEEEKAKSSPLLNSKNIMDNMSTSMEQQKYQGPESMINFFNGKGTKNEEQQQRIQKMRESRKRRGSHLKKAPLWYKQDRKDLDVQIGMRIQMQKNGQISPWQDYPSRLSSMIMKST